MLEKMTRKSPLYCDKCGRRSAIRSVHHEHGGAGSRRHVSGAPYVRRGHTCKCGARWSTVQIDTRDLVHISIKDLA